MNRKNALLMITFLMLVSACTPGRRLASSFVTKENNINVLLLPPPGLIKSHQKLYPGMEADSLVSLDLADSKFLSAFNDTAYVNYFIRSLRYHLSKFQVNVYGPENLDAFLQLDSTSYIFSVAQMELLELKDVFRELKEVDTTVYSVNIPRTNVENSVWFEYSELNHSSRGMQVLYSSQSSSDIFNGRIAYLVDTGDIVFKYTPFYLEEADVYDLAYFAGVKNAQYIFDFILNQYVAEKSKKPGRNTIYYQYDLDSHTIRRAYTDRFIRLAAPDQPE